MSHRDGSLKNQVKTHVAKYIEQDEQAVAAIERFKKYGKKLWVITNSDYEYTKLLLDYAYTPFLKEHKHWSEVFDLVITSASKPRFFTDSAKFLKVNPDTGFMTNSEGPYDTGIFQGGNALD